MSAPFIAQISIFPYSFTPQSWAYCDGQIMPIAQNQALYSLIGNVYGGDGFNTMGMPNLKGRTPLHSGTGPGLTYRQLGSKFGEDAVVITHNQMPSHQHGLSVAGVEISESDVPTSTSYLGVYLDGGVQKVSEAPDPQTEDYMHEEALASYGSGLAHENMQPYLGLPFMIALDGIYPPRS